MIWDVSTGRAIGEPMRHDDNVIYLAHSPLGKAILTAAADHTARLWDAATGKAKSPPLHQPKGFAAAAFAVSAPWVVIADREGGLRRWDTATGKAVGKPIETGSRITSLAVHPLDQLVATGDLDGRVRFWNLATALPVGALEREHAPVIAAGFAPDGHALFTVSTRGDARRWPLPEVAVGEPDRLDRWLQAVTGLSMDHEHSIAPMEPESWRSRRDQWERDALRGDRLAADRDPAAWHDARASDALERGDPFAAAWHLDRVLAERPDDWIAHARRAGARRLLADSRGAAEDEAELRRFGLADRQTDWDRHHVLDYLQAGRWADAVAVLDRLIVAFPSELGLYIDRSGCLEPPGSSRREPGRSRPRHRPRGRRSRTLVLVRHGSGQARRVG